MLNKILDKLLPKYTWVEVETLPETAFKTIDIYREEGEYRLTFYTDNRESYRTYSVRICDDYKPLTIEKEIKIPRN